MVHFLFQRRAVVKENAIQIIKLLLALNPLAQMGQRQAHRKIGHTLGVEGIVLLKNPNALDKKRPIDQNRCFHDFFHKKSPVGSALSG
ncbi:MAG: hypothetical protein Q4D61_01640 [Cardiobacteriaceae bacterium]|nr:hypothetical protein [Cardiobacteriaceae bacterium]